MISDRDGYLSNSVQVVAHIVLLACVGYFIDWVLCYFVWDAFVWVVHILAGSVASLLQPLGFHSGFVPHNVPPFCVPAIIEAARFQLQDCGDVALWALGQC